MRLGLLIALTALAAAGRLLLLALPNVALTFLVVAVAGLAYGPRMGAAVGGLAMLATSAMLTGPTPAALPGAGAMAALGALAGLLGRANPGPLAAGLLGAGFQALFSVMADAGLWLLFGREASLALLVAAGLLFNAPAIAIQAALFAGALGPILRALRAAGLAPAPPGPPRPWREVVLADYTTATASR